MDDRSLVSALKMGLRNFISLKDPAEWLFYAMGARPSKAGVSVNVHTSRQVAAVYACVNVLSEDVAKLPLILYKEDSDGNRERATDHPLYRILRHKPNPWQTAVQWRSTMMNHLLMRGNAYSRIVANGRGQVQALVPLDPDRIEPKWRTMDDGTVVKVWAYTAVDGTPKTLFPGEVLHVPGPGDDMLKGLNPIECHRESIGIAIAAQEFSARFYGDGMLSSGVLEHPGRLTPDAKKMLAEQWKSMYHGITNAHNTAVLEEGMKFTQLTINAKDAQFLESRKFQKNEIASIFRVPPHKIMDLERATYSNIESQSIDYVTDSLQPWMTRIEAQINVDLLSANEQGAFYAEHLVDALLRGDTVSRYNAYAVGRQWGWLSANDVRKRENMNLLPEDQGDMYLVPMNMIPADKVDDAIGQPSGDVPPNPDPTKNPPADPAKEKKAQGRTGIEQRSIKQKTQIRAQYERLIKQTFGRLMTREVNAIRQAVKKHLRTCNVAEMTRYVEKFYADHADIIAREMRPVLTSYADAIRSSIAEEIGQDPEHVDFDAEAFIRDYSDKLGIRQVQMSQKQIRELLGTPDNCDEANSAADAIEEHLTTWEDGRAAAVGKWEAVRTLGAVSATIYAAVGLSMVWRTTGDNCPLCDTLEGQTVRGGDVFVKHGDSVTPADDAVAPITVESDIGHPPLHRGCDCILIGVRQ